MCDILCNAAARFHPFQLGHDRGLNDKVFGPTRFSVNNAPSGILRINARPSDSPPGAEVIWRGTRRMHDFALCWQSFGPDC
ncbi:hypothetical protein FHS27_004299 [Rhodopirellula rubra]|uniref:Uncharacterized protein n=1 Tax=Aporhodopirellula rubra TaxID=980271 RepID=A0A7W5E1M0_9BACT|nr:hypothetical protein [Aporhodopirellula rubra]